MTIKERGEVIAACSLFKVSSSKLFYLPPKIFTYFTIREKIKFQILFNFDLFTVRC